MPRADRAHGHRLCLGLADDPAHLLDAARAVYPHRIDPLVAQVVLPGLANLVLLGHTHHGPRSASRCATPRSASAAIVFDGLTPSAVGTIDPSSTYSPS